MARSGNPVDVDKLRGENARRYLTQRQDVETRIPGSSLIQQIQGSAEIILKGYTGADPGTGVVILGLSNTGVVPGQYNTFVVDAQGRIVRAWMEQYQSGGGGSANSIANQSTFEQPASFWISGSGRIGGAVTSNSLTTGQITAQSLSLTTPLPVSSGGIGLTSVPANYVFAGPSSGVPGAPGWRALATADFPGFPWSRITGTPVTVAGYGIIDVYTRAQADQKFLSLDTGTVTQYLRGDKNWAELNTSVVSESTALYYTDARARAALSVSGTNLTYTTATGVLGLVASPVFDAVTLNNTPTQANQAATKQYVDTATGGAVGLSARDRFVVVNGNNKSYDLSFTPIHESEQVYLNGIALFEGVIDDYTILANTITLNASVILTTGDVIHVRYKH